jgi:hypothetical protein
VRFGADMRAGGATTRRHGRRQFLHRADTTDRVIRLGAAKRTRTSVHIGRAAVAAGAVATGHALCGDRNARRSAQLGLR